MTVSDIIGILQLIPHPEGGYYRQNYRSGETCINMNGDLRSVCTSIYYMLEGTDRSHFHRIQSDELWFFHEGEALEIVMLTAEGIERALLGNNLASGERPYFRVPADCWFAAKIKDEKGFSLVSCTVSPGFDFRDFELGKRNRLINDFPRHKGIIEEFTVKKLI
jgi:uncharacterized protein